MADGDRRHEADSHDGDDHGDMGPPSPRMSPSESCTPSKMMPSRSTRFATTAIPGRSLRGTGHAAWWSDEVLTRGAIHWVESLRALAVGAPVSLDADAAPESPHLARRVA